MRRTAFAFGLAVVLSAASVVPVAAAGPPPGAGGAYTAALTNDATCTLTLTVDWPARSRVADVHGAWYVDAFAGPVAAWTEAPGPRSTTHGTVSTMSLPLHAPDETPDGWLILADHGLHAACLRLDPDAMWRAWRVFVRFDDAAGIRLGSTWSNVDIRACWPDLDD